MTTRAQLEEILAIQRAQRNYSTVPRRKGGGLIGALFAIAILLASAIAMFFAVKLTASKMDNTDLLSMNSPSIIISPSPSTTTTPTATPVVMQVCTDIPDGRLHVRFAAGDGSEVRGYLAEGESVQVALVTVEKPDSQMIHGETWLRILSPVAGWVNARYLCKSE